MSDRLRLSTSVLIEMETCCVVELKLAPIAIMRTGSGRNERMICG